MIFLDHASATPVSPAAFSAMQPYFSEYFFNPSAPYLPAKEVRDAYEEAKNRLAHTIGAKGADLVITSGATESINLAFTAITPQTSTFQNSAIASPQSPSASQAIASPQSSSVSQVLTSSQKPSSPQVLILATEHASVHATAAQFNSAEIKVDGTGLINLADLENKITPATQLISVSLANNEIGTIQPLAEISAIISRERTHRLQQGNATPLYLHSDASQALALLDISVSRLGVDMLTLNSGKVYGPKGVGALYLSHNVKLRPIAYGGGQERGLRSGTENVPGVMGFSAAAVEAKQHLKSHRAKYTEFCQILSQELRASPIPPVFLGSNKHKLANFCSVSFPGIDAERLIYILEEQGVLLSTGAACSANKGQKSRTLTAIGLSDREIAGSLRISFGETNALEDIYIAGRAIVSAVRTEAIRIGLI